MSDINQGIDAFKSSNYPKALKLLQPLAEQGNAEAQCIIGNMYHLGLGLERSIAEAIIWYTKSADQGYGVASNNLAGIYREKNDLEAAKKWYWLAEQQGFLHTAQLKEV